MPPHVSKEPSIAGQGGATLILCGTRESSARAVFPSITLPESKPPMRTRLNET
jgi:hypothetical protein